MCIIMAKPKGIAMPDEDTMHCMWVHNPDGAGFMYVKDGRVHIEKGFMKYELFKAALKKAAKSVDFKNTAVVMHFRITTHGGTTPENTHPFPITDSIGKLKKLKQDASIAVAHNGIIPSVTPRKGISDTMEYIATQLAPLSKAVPSFYKDANLMLMISNATSSKLAFLTGAGKIYTVGNFISDGGRLYSNTSYEPYFYKKYTATAWSDYDDYYGYLGASGSACERILPAECSNWGDYEQRELMWLDAAKGDFVVDPSNTWIDGDDYAVDDNDVVYLYDADYDCFIPMIGYRAYTAQGGNLHFDERSGLVSSELVYLGDTDAYRADETPF